MLTPKLNLLGKVSRTWTEMFKNIQIALKGDIMCKKRNLNILGKQYYDFDVEKEKEINLNYRFDTQ